MVRKGTDEGFAAFDAAPSELRDKVGARAQSAKAFSVGVKAELLKLELAELRRDGREDRLQEILAEEAGFLKTNGIKADQLLSGVPVPSTTTPAAPAPVKLNGRQLAIVQLLLAYYAALSAEDTAALDKLLVKGANFKSGKDIVEEIERERQAERDFDAIGPVQFVADSTCTIAVKATDEFEVRIKGILKTFRKGKKTLSQREHDRFTVRIVQGQYKLVFRTEDGKR